MNNKGHWSRSLIVIAHGTVPLIANAWLVKLAKVDVHFDVAIFRTCF